MTLCSRTFANYGLRFDYYNGYAKAEHVPAGRFLGERSFPAVHKVPEWFDLNPRLGYQVCGLYDVDGARGEGTRSLHRGLR